MSFIADQQTVEDLNILGRFRPNSIFGLFNKVKTTGGKRLLEEMFRQPMTDVTAINQRSSTFRYFQDKQLPFPFENTTFRQVEDYLGGGSGGWMATAVGLVRKKINAVFLRGEDFAKEESGLRATLQALEATRILLARMQEDHNGPFSRPAGQLTALLADDRLLPLVAVNDRQPLSLLQMIRYDHLLRYTFRKGMERWMAIVYELDVWIAVSGVARQRGFSYAAALPADRHLLRTTALQHPALEKAVANPVSLEKTQNVMLLTGANMAGKSTFMKSLGIAVYLAHMGFPVAAAHMEFSVLDGLFTSINVSDNLHLGYSHFYAEVMRVKTVATAVSAGKNLLVIFDELFKGTNVKDAYDATLAVTKAFARYYNCLFVISTHIVEVGAALQQQNNNIQYCYLPTRMEGAVPAYTYRLTSGISSDRHGMMIIQNEKILDIIRSAN
ncbi:MAG TPA: DNA mismatch repair protein [Chitinophaga sp.]